MESSPINIDSFCAELLGGNTSVLSRAITLIESTLPEDRETAELILKKVKGNVGNSWRIGITGVPGVGKSTFIDVFGTFLTSTGSKVAVLAVDPTSTISKGSILGDKTRMEKLSRDANAFIRPSPTSGSLGGVTRRTREAMLLCEAAGFDVILVETVGVGQSEIAVRSMVDFFLLLMLPGAGDELQGIKKGIMEMADAVVINKADGTNLDKAKRAKAEYTSALHLFQPSSSGWITQVMSCSSTENSGIKEVGQMIAGFFHQVNTNGWIYDNRRMQALKWFRESINEEMLDELKRNKGFKENLEEIETEVVLGKEIPSIAARRFVKKLLSEGSGL